jgi:hypothetical protein
MVVWLLILLTGIISLFWINEWVYSLPTPVPENYKGVSAGTLMNLDAKIKDENKPLFLHFFNPACPCSKFNVPHFRSLVKQYKDKVTFAIVVLSGNKKWSAEKIQEMVKLDIPVLFDSTVATSCGVYSTPQAVIIDKDSRLYYRGNYNKSRYCTNKESNYAAIALDGMFKQSVNPVTDPYSLNAYGCQLPKCAGK